MRYEEEPLGCFQTLSYRLLGFGLYISCSLFSCFALQAFIVQLNLNSILHLNSGLTAPTGLDWAAVAFSFLCAGPVILGIYVLYLRDMRVIQVKDRVTPLAADEKRKKARGWPI